MVTAVHLTAIALVVLTMTVPNHAAAEETSDASASSTQAGNLAEYSPDFFDRYKPLTALDMVRQLPGFQIDEGNSTRGFGGTLGNILVDDKYLSAKRDTPTALLSRIPASQVARVELVRGQVRGIDLHGRVVVANIVLRKDIPAAIQWEINLLRSSAGPDKPGMIASLSDRWNTIDYNVGIDLERGANGEHGVDVVHDQEGDITEIRYDEEEETGVRLLGLFLNSSTWMGDFFVQLNSRLGFVGGPNALISRRVPQVPGGSPHEVSIVDEEHNPSFEIGVDGERILGPASTGKAILLFAVDDLEVESFQQNTDSTGVPTLVRKANPRTITREGIARVELDWSGLPHHIFQMNLEGAFNSLDSSLSQWEDTGAGPVHVNVPGANSRVEEVRGDILIKDTWLIGRFELAYGLGAEVSTITQTGDVTSDRDLSFLKPQSSLAYSPDQARQFRLSLAREVSQLDFSDFVSATLFEDDDLALGNPDLRPETMWAAEMNYERRFSADTVLRMSLFHHRISDVEDLLPLTADIEVPGNIGDGTRTGIRLEGTLPLDRLGLSDAKLDFKGRWQTSSVTDPVTGKSRQLTADGGFSGPPNIPLDGQNEYAFDIVYRQDFQDADIAWGWDIAEQADRPRFKVNELDIYDETLEVNLFVETTRWFGIKLRLEGRNLLNYMETRDRILYEGYRELDQATSRVLRERVAGRRLNLILSGSF
jgi:hypothetical protein